MPHQAYGKKQEQGEGTRPFASPFDQIDPEEYSGEVPDYLEGEFVGFARHVSAAYAS